MKFCPKCGKQLTDDALFCVGCGAGQQAEPTEQEQNPSSVPSQLPEPPEASPQPDAAENDLSEHIGKTCPFCKTKIVENDDVVVCPACEMAHHKSCWEENGGCTTFGCSGKPEGTIICYNCGADVLPEQSFCPKCGSPRPSAVPSSPPTNTLPPPPTACPSCGEALTAEQAFCPRCGARIESVGAVPLSSAALPAAPLPGPDTSAFTAGPSTVKKKSPGVRIAAAVSALVVVFAVISGVIAYNAKQEKIEQYKRDVQSFYTVCFQCGSDLEDVGNDIQTYWSKYINCYGYYLYYNGHSIYSVNDAVKYALYDNASTVNSIKSQRNEIQSKYQALKDIPSGSDDLQGLFDAVEYVYREVEDMYDCVIGVSGNYSTFKSNFSSCDSALANALRDLNNLLD